VANEQIGWIGKFLPQANTTSRREQLRAGAGALLGLLLTGVLSFFALRYGGISGAFLIAPMGASAVLLFCLPASPLAQPWSVVGGNLVSALIGVTCAHWIDNPMLAAPLAGCLAIIAMFCLRCLHPPGGAVALTAVLAGPAVYDAGYSFALLPVALNSTMMVLAAIAFNNLTGRRYPHSQQSAAQNIHATKDPAPTQRTGFTSDDLTTALKHYGQVIDVARDDLEAIIGEAETHAHDRRFGVMYCSHIMSKDVVALAFDTAIGEALHRMHHHKLHTLPVLNAARQVIGIVSQSDFLNLREHEGQNFEVVGQMMTTRVKSVRASTPVTELVPLMSDGGLHLLPVVDDDERFVGVVTQSDLVAALYAIQLAQAA
jgi:CBS domain-containing membrane protein